MKGRLLKYYCMVLILICPWHSLLARPVSYPGGWTIMQTNNPEFNALHVHYSPTAKDSIGVRSEYVRDGEWQLHGVQYNRLLKRANMPAAQANMYLKTLLGGAQSQDDDNGLSPVAAIGIAADWENRRFFTSYENRLLAADGIEQSFHQSARFGIAPYIANYGALHSWLMLQVDHHPEDEDQWTVTPLLRVFKGVALVEAGVSNQGKLLANVIYRF